MSVVFVRTVKQQYNATLRKKIKDLRKSNSLQKTVDSVRKSCYTRFQLAASSEDAESRRVKRVDVTDCPATVALLAIAKGGTMAAQTIEELEAEIKAKKAEQLKQLNSPFAEVGNAVVKRGPGRPPNSILEYSQDDAEEAHSQRLQQIKRLPDTATEEETREHFQKELYSVLPDIAANLKWDVKFGGSKERSEAGSKVMRALGLESKDVGNIGKGGQIVINMNGPANTLDIPLLKPVMRTVEAMLPSSNKKEDK